MTTLDQDIDALFADMISQLSDPNFTGPERQKLLEAAAELKDQAFVNALDNFRIGTAKFNELSSKLIGAAESVSNTSIRTRIKKLLEKLGDTQMSFEKDNGSMGVVASPQRDAPPPDKDDEKDLPPVVEATGDTLPSGSTIDGPVLTSPKTSTDRSFSALEEEYKRFFVGARFRSKAAEEEVHRLCRAAATDRSRYESVAEQTGIPWWFIAAIHLLESGRNFSRHLHNGDRLTARTKNIPKNRPLSGSPPFSWEQSAVDALQIKHFHERTDWSIARVLYRLEQYNGFGYRNSSVRIPTPYLWSLTTLYNKGKYSRDGHYDPNLVSKQCGAAAFLRGLVAIGAIDSMEFTGIDSGTGEVEESGSAVIKPINDEPPALPTPEHAFKTFFETNLPEVTNFRWDEFLTKGSSHHQPTKPGFGLNTDPPAELWPNVLPLARVLQRFREEMDAPVKLSSVYRCKAYNETLSGSATKSQHLLFKAADIICAKGSPKDWHKVFSKLRAEGVFVGGIGLYSNFVHIDVRGTPQNWTG
ncbi:MAG: peptidase M15A [Rhodobacteraceae bacterium]|nr:peptidase M15A [Paracoccaceae bacterium]